MVDDDAFFPAVGPDFFGPLASSNQTPTCFRSGCFGFGSSLVPDTGSKEVPGPFSIFRLAFGFLHSDFDAGGFVDQVYRGGHLVHILSAWSLGGGDHFFHLAGIKGQIHFFGFRQHGHGRRGGVDAALGLGGGDAFDLVGSRFKREMTPASFAVNANNGVPETAGFVGAVWS